MTRFTNRPPCSSRARYPRNEAEARAVAYIVEARSRPEPVGFVELVALLEREYPALGRGPRGRWSRYLVARIAARAGAPKAVAAHRVKPAGPVPSVAEPVRAASEPLPSFDRVNWAALEQLARAFGS